MRIILFDSFLIELLMIQEFRGSHYQIMSFLSIFWHIYDEK